MFDTVTGKFEKGPYFPKQQSKDSWETRTRDFYDSKLRTRLTSISHTLNRPEARIGIFGDSGILSIEASLPKLLHGNNLMAVIHPEEALRRLGDFVSDYVDGDIPHLGEMDYLRVDYCHNFRLGSALQDYISTLSKVSFLKHRRTTDSYGGVEWWSQNGRRIRAYDKYKEILENDEEEAPEARGILRFEIQLRKKSGFLQRRQKTKNLKLQDVLKPEIAYCCIVETLEKMCYGLRFQTQDAARQILDENFSFRKSTRLLGVLRRLQTESMDDIRRASGRSTFYADKKELKRLGFWPPSTAPLELPGLQLPPLEEILSHHIALTPKPLSESPAFADGLDSSAQAEKAA
jgi:Phage replication protein CRI